MDGIIDSQESKAVKRSVPCFRRSFAKRATLDQHGESMPKRQVAWRYHALAVLGSGSLHLQTIRQGMPPATTTGIHHRLPGARSVPAKQS